MSEHTTEETLMYLRQFLLPGNVQDGIDLEVPSWLVREAVTALAHAKVNEKGFVDSAVEDMKRIGVLEAKLSETEDRLSSITNFTIENSAEVPEGSRGDRDWWQQNAAYWYGIAQRNMGAEAKLSKMEEALYKAAVQYGEIGAPEVHRTWRDTMIETGRHITDERLDWRGLPAQDVRLDERIARAVAKDFLIWAFGHVEALAGGDDETTD